MVELNPEVARALIQMIDTVAKRGAVHGEELAAVATMRKALNDGLTNLNKEPAEDFS